MGSTASGAAHRRGRHSAPAVSLLCAALLYAIPGQVAAQLERLPEQGGRITSLGQPPTLHWHGGLGAGFTLQERATSQPAFQLYLGATHALLNPVAGLANIGLEAYVGARAAGVDGGGRALLRVPYVLTGVGLDYGVRDGTVAPLLTIYGPVRRGGIFVPGGLFRADIYPDRRSLSVGVSVPLGDRLAGRGRPLREHVQVALLQLQDVRARQVPESPELAAALDSLRVSAEWIRRLVVPFLDQDGRTGTIALQRTQAYLQALGVTGGKYLSDAERLQAASAESFSASR